MSEPVISLTSSDEEDNPGPPPKKKKTANPVPQVTLTLVNAKKKEEVDSIETVTLDSDDDTDEPYKSQAKATSKIPKNGSRLSFTPELFGTENEKVDPITLSDDEDERGIAAQCNEVNAILESILGNNKASSLTLIKKNGSTVNQNENETVSIIDSDSDVEASGDKQIEKPNKKSKELQVGEAEEILRELLEEGKSGEPSKKLKEGNCRETLDELEVEKSEKASKESSVEKTEQVLKESPVEKTEHSSKESNEPNDVIDKIVVTSSKIVNEKDDEKDSDNNNVTEEDNSNDKISKKVEINTSEDVDQLVPKEKVNYLKKSIESERSDEPGEEDLLKDNSVDSVIISRVKISNDSIVIDDSDEETEKENHCENMDIEPFPVNMVKTSASDMPGPSTPFKSESVEARTIFKKFLKMVEEKIVDSSFEEILPKKVPIIQKYFKRCGTYVSEKVFETLLSESTDLIRKAPNSNAANTAVLAFHKIFEHLKSHVAESIIEIEEDHLPKIKKLEKTLKLLRKRIKQLEEAEVNFDDDEDSAYIMLDRYQARLKKVYAKYCQYLRRNPYSGRATYDKISFINSKYNVINQALTKKYKNSVNFPSYYELEKYIAKTAKKEKLELSDLEVKHESKKCFKYLGSILQKKRRQELYDSHLDFIEFTEDPATKDIALENVLRKNYSVGKEKIDKIHQKFVNKQELGEDHVSTDVESSENSDSEDNGKKSRKKSSKKVKKKGGKTSETETSSSKTKTKSKIEETVDNCKVLDDPTVVECELKECTVDVKRVDDVENTDIQMELSSENVEQT